jgi:hypothetical protein
MSLKNIKGAHSRKKFPSFLEQGILPPQGTLRCEGVVQKAAETNGDPYAIPGDPYRVSRAPHFLAEEFSRPGWGRR